MIDAAVTARNQQASPDISVELLGCAKFFRSMWYIFRYMYTHVDLDAGEGWLASHDLSDRSFFYVQQCCIVGGFRMFELLAGGRLPYL